MKNVYITRIAKFLPNEPVENEAMEKKLCIINGKTSKARRIILRNNQIKIPLKIEWMEGYSYAFELDTCIYAGGDKLEDASLKPWSEYPADVWGKMSLLAMKQDVKLLGVNILQKGIASMKLAMEKHNITEDDIDYYLPHISSYYFKENLYNEIENQGLHLPWEKWFLNLQNVGNVGAGSIYLMLEELVHSGKLKKGDRIFLQVPESARFAYSYAYLTFA